MFINVSLALSQHFQTISWLLHQTPFRNRYKISIRTSPHAPKMRLKHRMSKTRAGAERGNLLSCAIILIIGLSWCIEVLCQRSLRFQS